MSRIQITVNMTRVALFVAVGFLLNGCFLWTTRDDGETLKQKVEILNDRLVKIEGDVASQREQLEDMISRAQKQVADLEDTLSRATRVLARNSADFGAELEEVRNGLNESKGALSEITHDLEQLGKDVSESGKRINEFALAAGLDLPVDESKVPGEATDHFNMIKQSLAAGRYGEVRSLSRLYQDRYPKARNQDEVQLMVGQSYVAQKRYAKALGALRRFADLYSSSDRMPEALYEMAVAFFKLGDCTDARILVDTIASRYAKSPFAAKADKLKQQMDSQAGKCTS